MNTSSHFEKLFAAFADEEIAGHQEFHQMTQFPAEIWKKMKDQRLFGIGIDGEYGGHGADFRTIAGCGKTLAEHGGNLGVAMSWMMHEIISRGLIARFGRQAQKNEYLPKLAHGEITASLAASEPDTGAHPKYIRTTAESISGGFRINGEKTFLTNGPMADLFIVIGITGHESGKKMFTAFLVLRNTPGLSVSDPMKLPILRPPPHCGIILNDCIVDDKHILSRPGHAYETIVKPFRTLEDAMLMGPVSGGLQYQLNQLKHRFRKEDVSMDDALILELGQLQCAVDALFVLSQTAAEKIDTPDDPIDQQTVTSLTLFFRKQAADAQERLNKIVNQLPGKKDNHLLAMANDVTGGIQIASNVAKLKLRRIGKTFMRPGRST